MKTAAGVGNFQINTLHIPLNMGENMNFLHFPQNFPGMQPHGGHSIQRTLGVQLSYNIGKLPQPCQKSLVRPLFQSIAAVAAKDEYGSVLLTPRLFGGLYRQSLRRSPLKAKAETLAGTVFAVRRPVGAADGGAQLHQSLGEFAGFFRIDTGKQLGDPPLCLRQIDGGRIIRQP